MANVTITIPDAIVPRLVAAMRATFPDVVALTDVQAFKAVTGSYWKKVLVDYETALASTNAQVAIIAARDQAAADSAAIG